MTIINWLVIYYDVNDRLQALQLAMLSK